MSWLERFFSFIMEHGTCLSTHLCSTVAKTLSKTSSDQDETNISELLDSNLFGCLEFFGAKFK
jgi:hypothetical protein